MEHLKTTIFDQSAVQKYNAKQQIGLRYTTTAKQQQQQQQSKTKKSLI